jgi:hypothetical protein
MAVRGIPRPIGAAGAVHARPNRVPAAVETRSISAFAAAGFGHGSTVTQTRECTTTPAQTLRWAVDDGASGGSLTGSTSFTTSWAIGSAGSGSEVLDGSDQITAEPLDDRGVAGETKRANVVLNRRRPYAPPSLTGGHDTRPGDWVDLEWTANKERDILGYRVDWAGPELDLARRGRERFTQPKGGLGGCQSSRGGS